MKKNLVCNLFLLLLLVGCSSAIPMNPTAKSILKENPTADIIQYENLIYINAMNLEGIENLEFTKEEKIGEVKKTTTVSTGFKDFYATKLAVGTDIFSTNTQIIIAELNGKQIPYIVLLEG
ncbi:hypothetical protein [Metasolibacillus meyeri]|uniref:hypothetical protein n=1 Tax=Metasolibacillus meyeri TaxID=1071052 RepID=UPI000D2FAE15|nr:hypothetical protein [Metasolibacillus meyeri]